MAKDDRIEQAQKWGADNKRAMDLAHNWCANISFKRLGGVGLVEQMSGLPIGHFAPQCQHAPNTQSYGANLAQSVVGFYDDNCATCTFRKPVGIPNLLALVTERDERRRQREAKEERQTKERADAIAARDATRKKIRAGLTKEAALTLDLIAELDGDRDKDAGRKLAEAAALAPETFAPEVVEYLFRQVEAGEGWIVEAGLGVLAQLPVDKARLVNAALRRIYGGGPIAPSIVEKYGEFADEQYIGPALPALIDLASPQPYPIVHRVIEPVESPLRSLYGKRRDAVKSGLKTLLARTEAHNVELAARGIRYLSKLDASLVGFLTDEMLSKLARAKWLVQGGEEQVNEALRQVRRTLVAAFDANPATVDKSIADYLDNATKEGTAELQELYESVVQRARRLDAEERDVVPTEATRLAFRRLVVAAAKANDDDLKGAGYGIFTGEPYELTPLVVEEIDLLLGSAANLAVRIDELLAAPVDPKDPLAGMTRQSRFSRLNGLMDCFVRWACIAAGKTSTDAIAKVLATMEGLPEQSERLRATFVGNFPGLAKTPNGLMQILPHYYSALVGSSARVRSDAATALGDMGRAARESMPSLVFEAFTALLNDSFVIVHQAAVRALERFSLPKERTGDVVDALWGWIGGYAKARSDDRFLVQLIELLAGRYLSREQIAGGAGSILLEVLMKVAPDTIYYESRQLLPAFAPNPHYTRFFLRAFEDDNLMANFHEGILDEFQRRPLNNLYEERAYAVEVGIKEVKRHPWAVGVLVEALTACGAWDEASRLAAAAYDQIADTTQYKSLRLHMNLYKIASAYEAAIAAKKAEALVDLGKQWRATLADIQKSQEENEKKERPFRRLLDED